MSKARSHYEILGVSRTATAQEIRTAYLRLMKRYHPDAARCDGYNASFAPLLNRCYAVLRDPEKRSQYDTQLLHGSPALLQSPAPRARRAKLSRLQWSAIMMSGAVAAGAFWLLAGGSGLKQGTAALASRALVWVNDDTAPPPAPLHIPLPDGVEARRMAHLARTLPTSDAERFSRACYAGTAEHVDLGFADSCVLFDNAFLYWRKMPLSASLPVYFADQTVAGRHRDVMIAFGPAAEQRLANLRQLAFQALMQGLEERSSARDVEQPPPDIDKAPALQQGER